MIGATLTVLAALERNGTPAFERREAGPIGLEAEARDGTPLPDGVAAFVDDVFAAGGAVLAGPGGGRFVYDLRERFVLSLAMLLRHGFGLTWEAGVVEEALRAVWAAGWRTPDLAQSGLRVAGTREFGELTAEAVAASVRG